MGLPFRPQMPRCRIEGACKPASPPSSAAAVFAPVFRPRTRGVPGVEM